MKRLILIVALVVIGISLPNDATAQFDLGKAWNKLVGNDSNKTPEPTRYDKLKENAPDEALILGTWHYASAKVDYFGDNMLAGFAIDQLDGLAQSALVDNGVKPGYFDITLNKGGIISGSVGNDTMAGEYAYAKSDASVTLTVTIDGVEVLCTGYVECRSNRLMIYLDADDIFQAYESLNVGYTDSTITLARDVISQFDGIYVAVSFSK